MIIMKRIIFIFLNCTWGIGATLVGLFFFIKHRKCTHRPYRGVIETCWEKPYSGLSLGLFIFTPNVNPEHSAKVRVHEYGHSVQNIVLGPFMLVVAVISVTWANHPHFIRKRREKSIPYTACFVESWASRWGEAVTKEEAIWN